MAGGVITTAGMVIDGRQVNGCLEIRAPNVVIRNSRISCGSFFALDGWSTDTVIEDSEIICTTGGDGIDHHGITARRVEIHTCENAIAAHSNITVEDSWIHDLEPTSVPGAHSDAAQLFGGTNIVLRHNTMIVPGANAAITRHIVSGPQSITIENNFLGGGTYTVYCPSGEPSFVMHGNRFADGTQDFGLSTNCNNPAVTWSGNFRDSNGSVVNAA